MKTIKKNRASSKELLEKRIEQNEKNQSLNLNDWAFSKIRGTNKKLKILELCCGTGKQTKYLIQNFPNSEIVAIDISLESLEKIRSQDSFDKEKIYLINKDLDSFIEENSSFFDIVFVSYGLYYAKKIDKVIDLIYDSLVSGARFIVLGPYGKNNKSLFDLLEKSGVQIDPFVKYSCSDFMTSTLFNNSLKFIDEVHIHTVVNEIKWTSIDDLLEYWRNSTFYSKKNEEEFIKNLRSEFLVKNYFIVEKHIMLSNFKKK